MVAAVALLVTDDDPPEEAATGGTAASSAPTTERAPTTVASTDPPATTAAPPDPAPSTEAPATTAPPAEGCLDPAAAVAEWPLRRRLAALVVVGVDPSGTGEATTAVEDHHVGGVFVGGNDTTLLTSGALPALRDGSPTGLVVAVDEEGGRVQRIERLDGDVPSARDMADTMTATEVGAAGPTPGPGDGRPRRDRGPGPRRRRERPGRRHGHRRPVLVVGPHRGGGVRRRLRRRAAGRGHRPRPQALPRPRPGLGRLPRGQRDHPGPRVPAGPRPPALRGPAPQPRDAHGGDARAPRRPGPHRARRAHLAQPGHGAPPPRRLRLRRAWS